ncbi:MAG TPA: hypothetical protein VM096_11785 [Vicinamibacterales bacterium]|nr:hypothetical protein [Vicinamibacterales bacterium]
MRRAAVAAVAAGVVAIYALRLDDAVGLIVDDAWYVVLAKALSEGRGLRLISSAAAEILPAVPPGFPAILAPVFLINPSFPDNLIALKLISVIAMLAAGITCWVDFTRHRDVPPTEALLLSAATVITPAFVFLATSTVMSECVFTFAQMLTVVLVERARRGAERSSSPAITAGLAGAAATLIRYPGVAVVAAGIVYFMFGRRWRQAMLFAITVGVCLAPWQLYARAHQPTMEERLAHGGTISFSYEQLLAMVRPGDTRAGRITIGDRVTRAGRNFADVVTRDTGAILVPAFYRGPSESGQELVSIVGGAGQVGSMGRGVAIAAISLLLSVGVLAGWIRSKPDWFSLPALIIAASVGLILLVGSQTFRYMVPLTPYLLLFFWRGLGSGAIARVAVLCLLGFNLVDHAGYIQQKLTGMPDWLAEAADVNEVLDWMSSHVSEPGAVASNNPGLVYLKTGRKTVASADPSGHRSAWQALGIRYVVALRRGERPDPSFAPELLFQTSRGRLWIVEIFRPRETVHPDKD